ncbi:hypothetical protein, partial [Bacteroides acidifaciens]|uniref:hypothetical protein n=1 Tax=Bacteroides acidifaciens TaxID=85831 RepID=UPI0025B552D8
IFHIFEYVNDHADSEKYQAANTENIPTLSATGPYAPCCHYDTQDWCRKRFLCYVFIGIHIMTGI